MKTVSFLTTLLLTTLTPTTIAANDPPLTSCPVIQIAISGVEHFTVRVRTVPQILAGTSQPLRFFANTPKSRTHSLFNHNTIVPTVKSTNASKKNRILHLTLNSNDGTINQYKKPSKAIIVPPRDKPRFLQIRLLNLAKYNKLNLDAATFFAGYVCYVVNGKNRSWLELRIGSVSDHTFCLLDNNLWIKSRQDKTSDCRTVSLEVVQKFDSKPILIDDLPPTPPN